MLGCPATPHGPLGILSVGQCAGIAAWHCHRGAFNAAVTDGGGGVPPQYEPGPHEHVPSGNVHAAAPLHDAPSFTSAYAAGQTAAGPVEAVAVVVVGGGAAGGAR